MEKVIYGNTIADPILLRVKEEVASLRQKGVDCGLAIVLVGSNPASIIYVENKLKAAANVGISQVKLCLSDSISTDELIQHIEALNSDPKVSGIIVQLPLPRHIDFKKVLCSVRPEKDVDGFHPVNVGKLYAGMNPSFVPCTALGCLEIIKHCHSDLAGKHVVIVGRSNIVGRPLSALLLANDCTVTICHSKTQDLEKITSMGDIVVCAIGAPLFFKSHHFKVGATVIDVGISRVGNKIVGDVDFVDVYPKVSHITPVPKGVGPLTVAFLLLNTVLSANCRLFNPSYG